MSYSIVKRFFLNTSDSYDRVVAITTFNRDKAWKKYIISLLPKIDYCLDLACGTGILTTMLREKANNIIGLDIIYSSISIAKRKGNKVIQAAAEYLPFKNNSMDAIVTSYLPKYCNVDLTIRECARVLRDGGFIIMHDFTYPSSYSIRIVWHIYFMILKCIRVKRWKIIFDELDKLIMESRWLEEIIEEMKKNGFVDIKTKSLTFGTSAILYARKLR
ncbi:MAG: methyltransferase domain-containing protein [Candidatus Nitrosocaldaceae archaeon]